MSDGLFQIARLTKAYQDRNGVSASGCDSQQQGTDHGFYSVLTPTPEIVTYLRQNAGVRTTSKVNNSSRPSSMAKVHTQV